MENEQKMNGSNKDTYEEVGKQKNNTDNGESMKFTNGSSAHQVSYENDGAQDLSNDSQESKRSQKLNHNQLEVSKVLKYVVKSKE